MQSLKYNFIPNSIQTTRVSGEIKGKKLVWNDGNDNYAFSIDKDFKPKNEVVLVLHKDTGLYSLKRIDKSLVVRYDRNVKRSSSPSKIEYSMDSTEKQLGDTLPSSSHLVSYEGYSDIDEELDNVLNEGVEIP